MTKYVYGIEGIDALGKSTLIEGILNKLGYYEVIHFQVPKELAAYEGVRLDAHEGVPTDSWSVYTYQRESFLNSMLIAKSGARIIFDRWHLGEFAYSSIYRGYAGDFVFQQEIDSGLADTNYARMILLTEDFKISRHFIDDGRSLGPVSKREEEQNRFLQAFELSNIRDKRIICVTDPATGNFKPKELILAEALADKNLPLKVFRDSKLL